MEIENVPLELWSDLTAVAHQVLRRLESDEVPAGVRRVAASDRLPPPLGRALVRELEANTWLREKVTEAWGEKKPTVAGAPAKAAALFLERPEGWESELEAVTEAWSQDHQLRELEQLQAETESLRGELELARSRAKAAEKRARQAEQSAAKRRKATKADSARARREDIDKEAELAGKLERMSDEMDELREAVAKAQDRSRFLRAALLRARRSGPEDPSSSRESAWSFSDPIDLARHLDQLTEASVAGPGEIALPTAGLPAKESPPKGVRPDDPAIVDWLLALSTPTTVVVDGYNVTYQLDSSEFHTGGMRARLNLALAELKKQAKSQMKVIVVYDSTDGGDADSEPGPVDIRFTERNVLADEVILDLVGKLEGLVAVVSSDRFVREGSEMQGALGLWSEALAGWISR
ncbi:MAG: NYN domain-containing protein [Acidimicrobiia bacterium]